jgi:type IV pilus assembly protein PilA
MLLQNLRARVGARLNKDGEAGFTLIELLVVMLILGILAAIALPAFFNQKDKATDSQAKAFAHSAQVAAETYSTENGGVYTGLDTGDLTRIETTLNGATGLAVSGVAADTYTVTAESTTGNKFNIVRKASGATELTCTALGDGGCPPTGIWSK